jgi:LacI family transcriptional regulator
MKRPTQVDVARIAGVSRGTVSFVINGQTDGRVPISEETRIRVLKAVAELGYVPDASARALRSGDTKTIGLVIPDIRNPHFWDNVEGVEQEARASGYHLLISNLGSEYGEVIYRDLRSQRIDGLILMGSYIDHSDEAVITLDQLQRRGLAVVEIAEQVRSDHQADSVVANYRSATTEVIAYLQSVGHRRIGFIYGVALPELGLDRLEPFHRYLDSSADSRAQDLLINCGPAIEDGYRAARRLFSLPDRPTAILAINDLLSIGVIRAAADAGLRIPQDLSLVGFDNILIDDYLVPRLSTVSKDAINMGRAAVRLVLERIEDRSRVRQVTEFPARFIPRESTGPAPVS